MILDADSYENAVFNLLILLEEFGYDWKFRKPVKIIEDHYTFCASLYLEHGKFNNDYIKGITAILDESVW